MTTTPQPERGGKPDPQRWVDDHGDALFRYALLRLANPAMAEDAVQETLLAALDAATRFQGRSTERTWLVGNLKHKVSEAGRKRGREISLGDMGDDDARLPESFTADGVWRQNPAQWGRDPDQAFEQRAFWDVYVECLKALPPQMAFAFTSREVEETSSREICKALGITATNLWSIMHRARTRLRNCLEVNWFTREL